MPGTMSGDERSKIIASNRSLRMIKNELESLCEREVITDEQYDLIMKTLPAEQSLHASAPNRHSTSSSSNPPPAENLAVMSLNGHSNPAGTNTNANPAPAPPPRNNEPQHIEIAHAVALFRYSDPDPRDLNFEAGDHISVTEYCNPEWWQGKNIRTGDDGIFPKNYVRVENTPSALASKSSQYSGERMGSVYAGGPTYTPPQPAGGYYGNQQQYQQQPPAQSNPYDGPVPPMALAEQSTDGQGPGKGAEMGKKFGKKLGNAAIFGAGATIGGNIVNSIF